MLSQLMVASIVIIATLLARVRFLGLAIARLTAISGWLSPFQKPQKNLKSANSA